MRKKFWLCSVLLSATSHASNVHVVMDTGATIDIRNYMSAEQRSQSTNNKQFTESDLQDLVAQQYPLVSEIPRISFEPYQINKQMPTNFALVGTDDVSQNWLKANYKRLRDFSVLVIVIDAPDLPTFNHFQSVLTRAGLKVVQSQSTPFQGLVKGYPALVANGVVYP